MYVCVQRKNLESPKHAAYFRCYLFICYYGVLGEEILYSFLYFQNLYNSKSGKKTAIIDFPPIFKPQMCLM